MQTEAVVAKNRTGPAVAKSEPALVVLGLDEKGKPHASWFDEGEAELATKAAGLMGMQVLPLATDERRALASKLPHGRVFASGRGFVPFVARATFDQLAACEGLQRPPKPDGGDGEPSTPNGPGRPRKAADSGTGGVTHTPGEPAGGAGDGDPGQPDDPHRPASWSEIQVGSLVLVSEGVGKGWFESRVVEARGADLYVLQWRDWPDFPREVRRREDLALLHPSFIDA